jgi:hypothetical protein
LQGSDEAVQAAFGHIRDEIQRRLRELLESFG